MLYSLLVENATLVTESLVQISLLKKGLRHQAEGMLTLSGHCQQLYAARMELIDYLPDAPPSTSSGEATEKEKDGQ